MFTYNTANELTALTRCNVASTYTYDAWGRTISLARDGQGASYTYAYGDKLTSVDADWEVTVDYAYNGLGQRVSRAHEEITTNYYRNGWSVVNEYFDDDSDNDIHTWSKTYVGGLGERAYSGGAYTYYFTDHLGSTEALYVESKDRVGGIGYTPYGTPYFEEGDADGVAHRYTGHDWDALTGQYFAPYRYYAPSMHRWLTRDPMGMVDGPNVYGYVRGNPVMASDRSGAIIEKLILLPIQAALSVCARSSGFSDCTKATCNAASACLGAILGAAAIVPEAVGCLVACAVATGGLGTALCVLGCAAVNVANAANLAHAMIDCNAALMERECACS